MRRNWVMGFAAATLLVVSAFTASAQRSGFSVYGPHGSVSVNVGGGGGYYAGGGGQCNNNRGYRQVQYRQQPPCNDNRYVSYNNCRPQGGNYGRRYDNRRCDDRRYGNGYAYNNRNRNGYDNRDGHRGNNGRGGGYYNHR